MTHMTSSSVAVSATTYDFRFNFNYTLTPVMRNHQQTVRKMYTIFHSFQLRDSETMLEYSSECVCFHIVLNKNFLLMPPWLKIRIDLISSITGVVVAIMLFIHNPRIFQKKKEVSIIHSRFSTSIETNEVYKFPCKLLKILKWNIDSNFSEVKLNSESTER